MNAAQLLKNERVAMVQFLAELKAEQWHAATLCEGWDVKTIVAHLVVRDTQPLQYGTAIATKGRIGAQPKALLHAARNRPIRSLLSTLADGPPWFYRLPGPAAIINLVENWVHHEDMRRGELQITRTTSAATHAALWNTLQVTARLMLRHITVSGIVAFVQPNGTALAFSLGDGVPRKADPDHAAVRVVGEAGELVLFLLGRKSAANLHFEGDQRLIAALRDTKMKI